LPHEFLAGILSGITLHRGLPMKMYTEGGPVRAVDDDLPADAKLPPAGFDILSAVTPSVPKTPVPASYAAMLGLLAGALVLMPLVYLALVGFLGWIAVWHLVQAVTSLQYGPYFIFHLPMALLGAVLVVFLTKPVFFPPKTKKTAIVTLAAEDEPVLFEAVHRLCDAIGSRVPTKIEVDCEPNAHARFGKGLDAITGGELILRIGLPLAAAMSVRQFLGVIAHELGHFNQVRGMRASYLVRRLNGFFVRVVFHRDRIDKMLDRLKAKKHGGAQAVYWITFAFVEPMRGLLWAMMVVGELMCCGVLRRMEHDADGVEACVCGVKDFARTSRLLLFLDIATRRTHNDLSNDYERGRLVDDLPRLIVSNARQLSEHRDDLLKFLSEGKTHWFDTHPCHNDRVGHVFDNTPQGAGLGKNAKLPAEMLFANFSDVCRRATAAEYNDRLGVQRASAAKLVPVEEMADSHAGRRADLKSLVRFFRGQILMARPVFPHLEVDEPITDARAAVKALHAARTALQTTSETAAALIKTVRDADGQLPALRAQLQLAAIFPGNPRAELMRRQAGDTARQLVPMREAAVRGLEMFEFSASERLTLAVRLLSSPKIGGKLTDDEIFHAFNDVGRNLPVLKAIEACTPVTELLIEQATLLQALSGLLPSTQNDWQANRAVSVALGKATQNVITSLRQLQAKTKSVVFPFAHASEGITVSAMIVPKLPDAQNLAATFGAAVMAVDRCRDLTFRSLAVLARWAERLEAGLGFEPLPDPVDEPKSKPATAKPDTGAGSGRKQKYWIGYGARAAAGSLLVTVLVWLSVSPPTLPGFPWGSGDGVQYQPAPFVFGSRPQSVNPVYYNTPMQPGMRMPNLPAVPSMPGFTGYQGRAVVTQPGQGTRFMPPGYVPPVVPSTPSFPMPGTPSVPGQRWNPTPGAPGPGVGAPGGWSPPTIPQTPRFNPNPGGFNPGMPGGMPGGGMPGGGFGGGHR
jgi:Zn-dependent protease with chaperone function